MLGRVGLLEKPYWSWMGTKLVGDIAEQSVILEALKQGFNPSKPIGDRLSYDLILDFNGALFRIQIKSAYYVKDKNHFVVNTRKVKTNRKTYRIEKYKKEDFDFAVAYIPPLNLFYIIPVEEFIKYKSAITVGEYKKGKLNSKQFEDAWNLMKPGSPVVHDARLIT
jgi:hypothetical protein